MLARLRPRLTSSSSPLHRLAFSSRNKSTRVRSNKEEIRRARQSKDNSNGFNQKTEKNNKTAQNSAKSVFGSNQAFLKHRNLPHQVAEVSGYSGDNANGSRSALDIVIWTIIGLNTAIGMTWLYAKLSKSEKLRAFMYRNFTTSSIHWESGLWFTSITYAFSHMDPFHFLFNMMAFNTFTSILRNAPGIGAKHVITLYLGGAVAASAAQIWNDSPSTRTETTAVSTQAELKQSDNNAGPVRELRYILGASGSVMALATTTTCLFPKAPILFFFVPMPLWVSTLGFLGFSMFYIDSGGNIAHAGHLGGAAFGVFYYLTSLRRFGAARLGMLWR